MMNKGYFHNVSHTTPTRFWVNNPTVEQARLAIEAGAVGCTTNPSYVSKLLSNPADRAYVDRTINVLLPHIADDSELATVVQRIMVARLSDIFMPMYEASNGTKGFVTIQGDPFEETDADAIIADGIESRKLGDNIAVKIPVTSPGIKAIATMVERDIPTMATEVMAISQAISIAEAYQAASENSGHTPPFYLTHITGILDDHFKRVIQEENIDISDEAVKWAGLSIAKKQYLLLKEKKYPGIMIGGGARKLEDFTELVGGDLHVTINWKGTAETLLDLDREVLSRIDAELDQAVIDELTEKLTDYTRAYDEKGMREDEYYDFGGVELFRSSFMTGWKKLLDRIADMRKEMI